MPPSIELNVGHVPSPRRARDAGDDGEDVAPLRILVLGDLSGRPVADRLPLAGRRPLRVDIDNLDDVFGRLSPRVEVAGLQDRHGVALQITLDAIDDFAADAVIARLPEQASERAPAPSATETAPATATAADPEDAAATLRRLLGGAVGADAPARAATPPAPARPDEVVDKFIRQVLGGAGPAATAAPSAPSPTAATGGDARTAALLRHVLRDPAWRHLEGAWRGVDRFVRELDMADGQVRLELLDVRADELLADLLAAEGAPARSALADALRGDGRGCAIVVSLEEFGAATSELSLLGGLAALAAAHGAVLLAGGAPALAALATSDAPEVLASSGSRIWRALRESALAPAIGLTFPRVLARLPYGPRHDPVAAFAFDELADVGASPVALHDALAWRSAALDAALLLARGHAQEGGDAGVETLVQLDDLPAFVDRSGDEPRLQAVAEAYLGERESQALQAAGFIALQSDRRVPSARVAGWRSIAADGAALRGRWRAA